MVRCGVNQMEELFKFEEIKNIINCVPNAHLKPFLFDLKVLNGFLV